MSFDHWCFAEQELGKIRTPMEFRTLLLRETVHFQTKFNMIYRFVMDRGEEYARTLFSLQRYTTLLRFPNRGFGYEAPRIYYECLKRDWASCVAVLQYWPSVKAAVPQLSYIRPHLLHLSSLHSAAMRTELRQPPYEKLLRVFVAQEACERGNRKPTPLLHRLYTAGVAKQITRHQWSLLGFWCIQVRAKVRHWLSARTFKPVPSFIPNTEPLALLVQRRPGAVPKAAQEFHRALVSTKRADDSLLRDAQTQWLSHMDGSHTQEFLRLCVRSKAGSYIAGDFLQYQVRKGTTLHLLANTLKALRSVGLEEKAAMKPALEYFLGTSRIALGPKLVSQILIAYHDFCRESWDFKELMYAVNVQKYIRDPQVSKTIVDYYMNRDMCIRLSQMWFTGATSTAFWQTAAVQRLHRRIRCDALATLKPFVTQAIQTHRAKMALRRQAVEQYKSVWETVVWRWRWLKAHRSCPICMETGHRLIALHGERRHAICRDCLHHVRYGTNRCPMCRVELAFSTFSEASSISYTSDHDQEYYEDPDYDDDRAYHYY